MAEENSTQSDLPIPVSKACLILQAARRLFLGQGYEVTSMDAIAAEAGVSKRTVYSHFHNKEMLFVDVMKDMCDAFGVDGNPEAIDPTAPPEQFLYASAKFMLSKVMDPRLQSVMRTIVAESSPFPEMGTRFWDIGPGHMRVDVTDYLRAQDAAGVLSVPDPELSAAMFQGMVAGPQFLPMIFTCSSKWPAEDIDRIARTATEMFLVAHRP